VLVTPDRGQRRNRLDILSDRQIGRGSTTTIETGFVSRLRELERVRIFETMVMATNYHQYDKQLLRGYSGQVFIVVVALGTLVATLVSVVVIAGLVLTDSVFLSSEASPCIRLEYWDSRRC
jgi:hypothetical protein